MKEDRDSKKKRLTLGIAFRRQRITILTPFCLPLLAGITGFLLNTPTTLLPTITVVANLFGGTGTTVNLFLRHLEPLTHTLHFSDFWQGSLLHLCFGYSRSRPLLGQSLRSSGSI